MFNIFKKRDKIKHKRVWVEVICWPKTSLMKKPSDSSKVVCSVRYGDNILVLNPNTKSPYWYEIDAFGVVGYIRKREVRLVRGTYEFY